MRVCILLATLAACGSAASRPAGPRPEVKRVILPTAVPGLSDLARDPTGALWAVAERDERLVNVALEGTPQEDVRLSGVPEGLDTESLAFVSPSRLLIGTESNDGGRATDLVLVLERSGARATVVDRFELPYRLWDLTAGGNKGIEGLCAAGDRVLAASEVVGEDGGRRYAPLAVRKDGAWRAHRLWLTSEKGKISAIACREGAGGELEVVAVERHHGVGRILGVHLGETGTDHEPAVLADLAAALDPLPNIEGIVFGPPGTWVLVTDNSDHDAGPSEALVVTAR